MYKLTVVSLYWESICSWHFREFVGILGVKSMALTSNKEDSGFGSLPKCVWSLHSNTRISQVHVLFSQIYLFEVII